MVLDRYGVRTRRMEETNIMKTELNKCFTLPLLICIPGS
jgi:hypothetical protein